MSILTGFEERTLGAIKGYYPVREISARPYASMRYPRLLPMMRFRVRRYAIDGFGHLMVMQTRAMGGLMQLVTASFTPNSGVSVPYLLIDMMAMGKKRTVFVEYYDTTAMGVHPEQLYALHDRYADVPDYAEKPHWYVDERKRFSLIKGGTSELDARLTQMVTDSVTAYLEVADQADRDPQNLRGLAAFADRMVREGNPSTGILEKVLGKEGAERFFREAVMPLNNDSEHPAQTGERSNT